MQSLRSAWKKVGDLRNATGHAIHLFHDAATHSFKVRVHSNEDDRMAEETFEGERYNGSVGAIGLHENDNARLGACVERLILKLDP